VRPSAGRERACSAFEAVVGLGLATLFQAKGKSSIDLMLDANGSAGEGRLRHRCV
jgi:hypothetical protein